MKIILKLFTSLMVLVLLVTSSFSVNVAKASSNKKDKSEDSTLTLKYNGIGSFSKDINKKNGKLYNAKKKNEVVYEVLDPNNELPFNLVIQSSEDQFQPVAEKKINVFNKTDIENDDNIPDYIKEDILKIINSTEQDKLSELSLTVYSPELILESDSATSNDGIVSVAAYYLPTVYYTGYGSQRYKDEVLYNADYASNYASRPMSGKAYAQEQYTKFWENVGKFLIGLGSSALLKNQPIANTLLSFFDIFGGDTAIGGSSEDKIYVRTSNEDKYRKYTSIMYPYSDYKLAAVVDRATFEIYTEKYVSGITTENTQKGKVLQAPNWMAPDVKAYEYKSSIGHYRETFDRYSMYGLELLSGIQ